MATFGTFTAGQILSAAELNAGLPVCVLTNGSFNLTAGAALQVPFTS
jgi:hypothetical protein